MFKRSLVFTLMITVLAIQSRVLAQPVADVALEMSVLEQVSFDQQTVAITFTNLGPDTLTPVTAVSVQSDRWLVGTRFSSLDEVCQLERNLIFIPRGGFIATPRVFAQRELRPNQRITCFVSFEGSSAVSFGNFTLNDTGYIDPVPANNTVYLYARDIGLDDLRALTRLYLETGGDHWFDNTGWLQNSADYCAWHGVTCNADQAVTALDLAANNLSGEIPEQVLWMEQLERVDLSGNDLTGELPRFWELLELTHLDLSDNQLAATLPPWLLREPQLAYVNLSGNRISGQIPRVQGPLHAMRELRLADNRLYGFFQDTLADAGQLAVLDLSGNFLIGDLPDRLPPLLETLHLSHNWFTGSVPRDWREHSRLASIDLSTNRLDGSIPGSLGRAANLQILNLSDNGLTGDVPASLGRSNSLEQLDISNNRLSGPLPQSITHSQSLQATTDAALLPGSVQFSLQPRQAIVCGGSRASIRLTWQASGVESVEVRRDGPDGNVIKRGTSSGSLRTGQWVANGTRFYLVDAVTGQSLADLEARVTKAGCAERAIEVVPNPVVACAPEDRGRVRVEWNATPFGSPNTEIRIDSPAGTKIVSDGPRGFTETGFWVEDGTRFFLLDSDSGEVLDSDQARLEILRCL